MFEKSLVVAVLIGLSLSVPVPEVPKVPEEEPQDFLSASNIQLEQFSNILMSPHIDAEASDHFSVLANGLSSGVSSNFSAGLSTSGQTSHLLEASKDAVIDAAKLPFEVSAESKAVGAGVSAGAAIKGTAVGSAIATPIIVKAVALPGVAAAKTAGLLSIPNTFVQNLQTIPEFVTTNLKTVPEFLSHNSLTANLKPLPEFLSNNPLKATLENSANGLAELVVIPTEVEMEEDTQKLANAGSLAFNKTKEHFTGAVSAVKAGALAVKAGAVGLAAKPFILVKKVAHVAGRAIMKPIAIITGAHLKMLGTGLTLAGKLIGGTGAGIAKAGTAVKYAGLGGIGMGASAVAWGFDKSTFTAHHSQDIEV